MTPLTILQGIDFAISIIEELTRKIEQVDTDALIQKAKEKDAWIDQDLLEIVKRLEGFSSTIYTCPAGYPTIGYGRRLDTPGGITAEEAIFLLNNDIARITFELNEKIGFLNSIGSIRKAVLIIMAYQLGITGLLKFKKTLKFLEVGDYEGASYEMLNSKWANQTPRRANELALSMKNGIINV